MPRAAAPRRLRRGLVYAVVTCGFVVGCQLIVSSDVPEFQCSGDGAGACPMGLVCDTGRGLCVPPGTVVDEDGDPPRADARVDGGVPEGSTSAAAIGAACVVDRDCEDGLLCGTSTVLTTAIVPANPVCTRPCCTSEECPGGFVCFPAGTGGNYCVSAEAAKRAVPAAGGKSGGNACATGADCRSGLCLGRCSNEGIRPCDKAGDCDGGTCTLQCGDSCCGASDCAAGSLCRLTTVAEHLVWACGVSNGPNKNDLGETCAATVDCKNDNCVSGGNASAIRRCTPPCCSSKDCTALGAAFAKNVCAYGGNGSDRIKWCFVPAPNTGICQGRDAGCERNADCDGGTCLGANGSTCSLGTECISRYCDAELRRCATACCVDDDCAAEEVCRPSREQTPFLRCIPRP